MSPWKWLFVDWSTFWVTASPCPADGNADPNEDGRLAGASVAGMCDPGRVGHETLLLAAFTPSYCIPQ
jgi:hypothetical protein